MKYYCLSSHIRLWHLNGDLRSGNGFSPREETKTWSCSIDCEWVLDFVWQSGSAPDWLCVNVGSSSFSGTISTMSQSSFRYETSTNWHCSELTKYQQPFLMDEYWFTRHRIKRESNTNPGSEFDLDLWLRFRHNNIGFVKSCTITTHRWQEVIHQVAGRAPGAVSWAYFTFNDNTTSCQTGN